MRWRTFAAFRRDATFWRRGGVYDDLLRACGCPARCRRADSAREWLRFRALLARLTEGSASVGELAAPFDMTFAAVSKHLRVLQDAGLVSRGRDAQYRPASLDARPLRAAASWIGDYRQFWDASFDALYAHLTTKEQP